MKSSHRHRAERDWFGVTLPPPEVCAERAGWRPDEAKAKGRVFCPNCGRSVAECDFRASEGRCPACRHRRFPWTEIVRLGAYRDDLRTWVQQIKFQRHHAMGIFLGKHLARSVTDAGMVPKIDLVIPMPSTFRRRIRRGIDHSGIIARVVARQIRRPYLDALRKSPGRPQRAVRGSDRRSNVSGTIHPAIFIPIRRFSVLLVDDIVTTHSSIIESSNVLRKECRAATVYCAVIAVTEDHRLGLPTSKEAEDRRPRVRVGSK